MTPLPGVLGGQGLVAWRLDREKHAGSWESGEGAFQVGGRWNPAGVRAVYASLDPSTAILEVAVHKGFKVLDTQPHVMTAFRVADPSFVRVYQRSDIPDPDWLDPNVKSPDQRAWGKKQLEKEQIIVLPSAVSGDSWNLVFRPPFADDVLVDEKQKPFVLDPRLHPQAKV